MNSKQTESKIWKQIVQVNEEEHTRPSLADLLVIDRKDTENEEHLKERTEMHCNEDTDSILETRRKVTRHIITRG